jgi:hypothetical protein
MSSTWSLPVRCSKQIRNKSPVSRFFKFNGRLSELRKLNVRGSFQQFCTLYVFSLKMNLFYKIHLQAFNVTSIVLYHSGPTYGQVCLDVFVVDASEYSSHFIRHLLNASEAFPTEWFLQFWEQVKAIFQLPLNILEGRKCQEADRRRCDVSSLQVL